MPDSRARNWRSALLPETATLAQAIASLNRSALRIVMLVAADDMLIGTITDGDVRRGLLRGLALTSSARDVVKMTPLVVPPEMNHEAVIQLMRANAVQQVPVVDNRRRVVGLHLYDDQFATEPRPNVMVLMAGGRGTRLHPLTESCPKPMLSVGGKPMLEQILDRARADRFSRFIITVHHLGHIIEEHFGDGRRWNVTIEYVREQDPLGTAGGLRLLRERPSVPMVITNGDILSDVRFGEMLDFHRRHDSTATMAVRAHELQNPFGVVQTDGLDIVGFEEKPIVRSYVNAGIYVLEPRAVDALPPNEVCDMPALFMRLRALGERTIVYPVHEPWLDIGRSSDYRAAQQAAAAGT